MWCRVAQRCNWGVPQSRHGWRDVAIRLRFEQSDFEPVESKGCRISTVWLTRQFPVFTSIRGGPEFVVIHYPACFPSKVNEMDRELASYTKARKRSRNL